MTATKWTLLALLVLVPLMVVQQAAARGLVLESRKLQQGIVFLERAEQAGALVLAGEGDTAEGAVAAFLETWELGCRAYSEYDKASLAGGLAALFLYEEDGFRVYRPWEDNWILTGKLAYGEDLQPRPKPGVVAILKEDKPAPLCYH